MFEKIPRVQANPGSGESLQSCPPKKFYQDLTVYFSQVSGGDFKVSSTCEVVHATML